MCTKLTLTKTLKPRLRAMVFLLILGLAAGVASAHTSATYAQSCGGSIRAGQAVTGQIARAGLSCRYTFTGRASDVVAIRMAKLTPALDPYLEIAPPSGAGPRDNDGGGNRNAAIAGYRLPSGGAYTIQAKSNGGQTSGAFTLALATCANLPPTGRSANGNLASGQIACYLLSTTQPRQTVTIRMDKGARADRNFEPALELYAPNGSLVPQGSARGSTRAELTATLANSGVYTVIARSSPDQGAGQFTIQRTR